MPRRSANPYPPEWPAVAAAVKAAAGYTCVRCHAPHDPASGHTLTVHHLDLDPANNAWWNTIALCQRCHLSVQNRVDLRRPWLFDHTPWFQPYVAGWYAVRYLGLQLSRPEVEARREELLALERAAVLPWDQAP